IMTDSHLVVIFRTRSDVEASIVRGLLEAHDLPSILSSPVTHSVFPLSVNELGEVRISVHASDADEARRIIESHRTELPSSRVEPARGFIVREFGSLLEDVRRHGIGGQDYKSALQEYLQSHDHPLPEYRLAGEEGPDHRKLFRVQVVVRGDALAEATGTSKKE